MTNLQRFNGYPSLKIVVQQPLFIEGKGVDDLLNHLDQVRGKNGVFINLANLVLVRWLLYLTKGMCRHNTLSIILFCNQNRGQLSMLLPLCVFGLKNMKKEDLRYVGLWHGTGRVGVQTASVNGLCNICLKSNWSKGNWFGRKKLLVRNSIWLGLEGKSWFEP